MSVKSSQEQNYIPLLDSLARFYNSQITVHVGYALTVTASVVGIAFGVFSSIIRPERILPMVGTIAILPEASWESYDLVVRVSALALLLVGVPAYFLCNFRYLFKYLIGRTQYYIALSDAVWEHMGLKTPPRTEMPEQDYALRLKTRALSGRHGIEDAVVSLFEARLFLSLLGKTKHLAEPDEKLSKEQREERDKTTAWISRNLKESFDLGPDILHPTQRPYARQILWYRGFEKLLFIAYKSRIKDYCKYTKEETDKDDDKRKFKRKGELLNDPNRLLEAECQPMGLS